MLRAWPSLLAALSVLVACGSRSKENVARPESEIAAPLGDRGSPDGVCVAEDGADPEGGEGHACQESEGPRQRCGPNVCGAGEVCCNESCGYCAPPGGACTKELCLPGRPLGGGAVGPGNGDPAPETGDCASDADCRLSSRYCGGCECLALPAAEPDPPCLGPSTRCFADPCRDQRAVCAAGRCTTVIE